MSAKVRRRQAKPGRKAPGIARDKVPDQANTGGSAPARQAGSGAPRAAGGGVDPDLAESRRSHLVAVDALRGFTIVWILGGDAIVEALARIARRQGGWSKAVADQATLQLTHVQWEGLRFYDLIFPLFLFITGVSIVLSLGRLVARRGRSEAYARVGRRALVLFALGVIVGGGLAMAWPDVRIMGVLQRIAVCYLVAGLLFLHLAWRGLLVGTALILVGYWALLTFVPVPGLGAASYTESANLVRWVDEAYLPGRRWYGTWDPEGLLGSVGAVASCLIGVLAGLVLTSDSTPQARRSVVLMAAGAACLVAGSVWGLQFPVIKKIWTSSFVLVAGGCSLLLLGALHQIIDVLGYRRWAVPLVWVGANAIALYLVQNLVGFESFAKRIAGGDVRAFFDATIAPDAGLVVIRLIALGLVVTAARYLYRRGIFLRV